MLCKSDVHNIFDNPATESARVGIGMPEGIP